MLQRIVRILCQKKVIATLIPEVAEEIFKAVPADWMRFDLEDKGRLWSRSIKPGEEAKRPGLGEVPRLKSNESEYTRDIEGGHEACVLMGIGETSGRLILRRKDGPFGEEDLRKLRAFAETCTLGLRARPFNPPPKARNPFEEGPLV